MVHSKSKLALIAVGLVAWACITRPLICHFCDAIPCNGLPFRLRSAPTAIDDFVPGDHLQLLYNFWLCRDMICGKTPFFYNLYEFNSGNDEESFKPDPLYVPFSLVYAAVSAVFGHAAGYNAAGLFATVLGLLGFMALSRRYVESDLTAGVIALVATCFPYRWACLLGGSPTGLAATLVPWLLFGLDTAVRDRRPSGGFVAGAALFSAFCSDLHVFYFSTLIAPFWCGFAYFARDDTSGGTQLGPTLRALLPAIVLGAAAIALSFASSGNLTYSTIGGGYDMETVRKLSPVLPSLFIWRRFGYSNYFFAGNGLAALLFSGFLFMWAGLRRESRHAKRREWLLALILGLAILGIFLLGLGANGPFGGLPVRLARRILPKYRFIRQPVKILCLLPPTLAVLLSVQYRRTYRAGLLAKSIALSLAASSIAEHILYIDPVLCRIPDSIPAYAIASEYAHAHGIKHPRAVCLPLWPGDSHVNSLYLYGILESRLRLINGYSPAVPVGYEENVAGPLRQLAGGAMDADVIERLRRFGITFVIFHGSPFLPEKHLPPANALALLRQCGELEEIASRDGVVVFALRQPHDTRIGGP